MRSPTLRSNNMKSVGPLLLHLSVMPTSNISACYSGTSPVPVRIPRWRDTEI